VELLKRMLLVKVELKTRVDYVITIEKISNMKKIIIGIVVLSTISCGVNQLTQREMEINYELDKLWIEYKYKSDSLINELYKKQYGEKNNNR
jgi:Phr family secreted Rap phosphatase inhibitor